MAALTVKKRPLKPETIYMHGATQKSLRTAFAQYLDWQRATCEDLSQENVADASTFLDWVNDELECGK